jgi:hypothetical protein
LNVILRQSAEEIAWLDDSLIILDFPHLKGPEDVLELRKMPPDVFEAVCPLCCISSF